MVATVTLSVEIELAWGHHDLPPEDRQPLSDNRAEETAALHRLLKTTDSCGVPITFDILGHLLQEQCSGDHAGPHPDGWFEADPGTDVHRDPLFYAPDLVENICESEVSHEVATHTYSHILCDEVDPSVLDWELSCAETLHRKNGLSSPRSLIPPRHRPVDKEVLSKYGIDVVRVPIETERPARNRVSTFLQLLNRRHPISHRRMVGGILETYCTPYPSLTAVHLPSGQSAPHPAFRCIPISFRQRLHRRFLQRALEESIRAEADLHLWTHLYNISNNVQWHPVRWFLNHLSKKADQGECKILPMQELTDTKYKPGG
jgi:hypothetical protein